MNECEKLWSTSRDRTAILTLWLDRISRRTDRISDCVLVSWTTGRSRAVEVDDADTEPLEGDALPAPPLLDEGLSGTPSPLMPYLRHTIHQKMTIIRLWNACT